MSRPPSDDAVDVLVVGGGINGVGIARDAAGRGLSVVLCEQGDLACATSSASSKLIHGGLRYLEHGQFRLVREALAEREVLLRNAPHIIAPIRFVLPHEAGQRPAWMIRAGLFLYDHLARYRRLAGSHAVDLRRQPEGTPLQGRLRKGFVYADCSVDDSRLVVLNALDAHERGATVLTRTRCVTARRDGGVWTVVLRAARAEAETVVRARAVVNATGPWASGVLEHVFGVARAPRLCLVKGSHIVLPRLYAGDHAYILQNVDRRVVFVIPYQHRFSLVGTTEVPFEGEPAEVAIDASEVRYLCDAVSRCFAAPVSPADVVWSYAGVRPLADDTADSLSAASRHYALDLDGGDGHAPLLSVLGGKITTYRRLAEQALDKLAPHLPSHGTPWTATAPLPGGHLSHGHLDGFVDALRRARPWLPDDVAYRYARAYGSRAEVLLGESRSLADLGHDFGAGLYERELAYLVATEWASTAEDVLWRRTKLGLELSDVARQAVARWLARNVATAAASANRASSPIAHPRVAGPP